MSTKSAHKEKKLDKAVVPRIVNINFNTVLDQVEIYCINKYKGRLFRIV